MSRLSGNRIAIAFVITTIGLGMLGCSQSGPRVVPVSGTATHQGKPLPNLFINLKPVKGRPGWTMTDAQGKFEVEYNRDRKGMLIGEYVAWVHYQPSTIEEEMAGLQGQGGAKSTELTAVLEKYGTEEKALKVSITGPTSTLELKFD